MKVKLILISLGLLIVILLALTIRPPDLLRYANTSFCNKPGLDSTFASWHLANHFSPLLIVSHTRHSNSRSTQAPPLWIVNPETDFIVEAPVSSISGDIRAIALAGGSNRIAITTGYGESAELFIAFLDLSKSLAHSAVIKRAERAAWHPKEAWLAAIYFPAGLDQASNIIALFDVENSTPIQMDTIELKDVAIKEVLGWSHDGQVLAASLYEQHGETIYYIFSREKAVERSAFAQVEQMCIASAAWSPKAAQLAFSAKNSEIGNWDILVETVDPTEGTSKALLNLTNSPGEDEFSVTWSPDGKSIAYITAFENEAGLLQQELFIVNLAGSTDRPVQLTYTPGDLETNPVWLSETEVAFLSWSSQTSTWSLRVISIVNRTVREVLKIPDEWPSTP